jgi:hypothetical protein
MRGHCVCLVAILTIVPSTVWAASDAIPTLDVRPVCRGIASQSADPGVGQSYNEAYHLTGDGVVVPVVRHLATHLLEPILAGQAVAKRAAA